MRDLVVSKIANPAPQDGGERDGDIKGCSHFSRYGGWPEGL